MKVEERFREVDSGAWDGLKEGDPKLETERGAYRALPPEVNYITKRGGTGESWEEVERRMAEGLKSILQKHTGETIVIVSHEGPMVYFLKAIGNLSHLVQAFPDKAISKQNLFLCYDRGGIPRDVFFRCSIE